ncbi:AAA family ATPase [Bradyrhizobium elkanii]
MQKPKCHRAAPYRRRDLPDAHASRGQRRDLATTRLQRLIDDTGVEAHRVASWHLTWEWRRNCASLNCCLLGENRETKARLIALAGLPGTGKSGVARLLAPRLGAMWLRIDTMDQAIWTSPAAPRDLQDWTYRAAQAVAVDNLALGFDVLADCVNDCQAAAQRAGADVKWLEIVCSDPAEHRRRVETRTSDIAGLALPDWDVVAHRAYDAWDRDRLIVDTAHRSLEACVDEAFALLGR